MPCWVLHASRHFVLHCITASPYLISLSALQSPRLFIISTFSQQLYTLFLYSRISNNIRHNTLDGYTSSGYVNTSSGIT
jgi:hypothetical protein